VVGHVLVVAGLNAGDPRELYVGCGGVVALQLVGVRGDHDVLGVAVLLAVEGAFKVGDLALQGDLADGLEEGRGGWSLGFLANGVSTKRERAPRLSPRGPFHPQ
jgi:hypothetical protein